MVSWLTLNTMTGPIHRIIWMCLIESNFVFITLTSCYKTIIIQSQHTGKTSKNREKHASQFPKGKKVTRTCEKNKITGGGMSNSVLRKEIITRENKKQEILFMLSNF